VPLPAAAQAIQDASSAGVTAAVAGDREAFGAALIALAALDAERVRVVLGHVVRALLEELHPDGLSADDVRGVLPRCVRAVIGWYPEVDPALLVVVLSNALGIGDPDDEPRETEPAAVTAHAVLLTADLVTAAGHPVAGHLNAAIAEIARAETIEMP
jgi:hypothetical protein